MERKSFEDRLNEIYWELCKNWTEIAKEAHVNIRMLLDIKNKKRGDRGINLRFVEKLGYGHGLIPIAFYKESDGQIENLGIEGFFYGEKIYNYVGRVFEKYRELNNLSTRELGERVDISHAFISLLERGVSKGTIQTIERIGKGLGLAPAYLLQRFPIAPLIIDGKLVDVDCVFKEVTQTLESYITPSSPFEQAVRTLENYIAYSKDLTGIRKVIGYADKIAQLTNTLQAKGEFSKDPTDLKRIIGYADRINVLNQALKTRYDVLEGQEK